MIWPFLLDIQLGNVLGLIRTGGLLEFIFHALGQKRGESIVKEILPKLNHSSASIEVQNLKDLFYMLVILTASTICSLALQAFVIDYC